MSRVVLEAGDLRAAFVPDVGMVGVELRHRGEPLLALPGGTAAYRAGHTTGLPLLHPWANRLAARRYHAAGVTVDLSGRSLHTDGNGLPIHGTMTAQPGWDVTRATTTRLVARFDFAARPDLLASFPFPHRLEIAATLAPAGLTVTTTLAPTGGRVPVSFGYHPYLRLPGAPRREWSLGIPACEQLVLDERGIPTGATNRRPAETASIGRRTFDDGFRLGRVRRFSLAAAGRQVELHLDRGYPYAQVYVPPGKAFACIEPMTAPTNALVAGGCPVVASGDRFRARFHIRVRTSPPVLGKLDAP
jgi:galactose mutarotase-like enzyme